MEREIVPSSVIDSLIAKQRYEESMEDVKEGLPSDYILQGDDSPFEKYIQEKTAEYKKRMETFEEEMEERIARNHLEKDENGEIDEEELQDLIKKPAATMKAEFIEDDDLFN